MKKINFASVKKILVIDNYDSFVYNVVQLLRESSDHVTVEVRRNDRIDLAILGNYDGVVLSPGPGIPEEAIGLMTAIREIVSKRIPVLGICLGHQALAESFGVALEQMPAPLHGHATTLTIFDTNDPLLQGLRHPVVVGRYHSWRLCPGTMPDELIVSSCDEQGNIMSFYHRTLPAHGVQFHPESCISNGGTELIHNWLATL